MGAWGPDSFENDSALDTVNQIVESTSYGYIEAAFLECGREFSDHNFIELDLACAVIVGAEVIAALRGAPSKTLPKLLSSWIAENRPKDLNALSRKAAGALHLVTSEDVSELKNLWEESNPSEWYNSIRDLKERMGFDQDLKKLIEAATKGTE